MPTYDAHQSTFYLSMLANNTSRYKTANQQTLGNQYILALAPNLDVPLAMVGGVIPLAVQQETIDLIGKWKLAWGPSVALRGSAASNSMFVAFNEAVEFSDGTYPTYVVAVAGTDPYSAFDWIVEDANVVEYVDFNAFVDANGIMSGVPIGRVTPGQTPTSLVPPFETAHISKGTARGVSTLAHSLPTPSGLETTKKIGRFLKSSSAPDARVIFTGHSLGGALSPTLALFLQQRGDLDGFERALVYPTAGPTPGNAPFNAEFEAAFAPTPAQASDYKVWNRDIINSRDVVPHAWQRETLEQIFTIYGNGPANPLPRDVKLAIDGAIGLSVVAGQSGMVYERIPHWVDQRKYTGAPPDNFQSFLSTLAQEHINAYYQPDIYDQGPGVILPQPPEYYYDLIETLPGVTVRGSS
jgi:hypothetical protein